MADTSVQALRKRIDEIRKFIDRDKAHKELEVRQKNELLKQIAVIDQKISIYNNSINKKQEEIADIKKDMDALQDTRQGR
jgi:hypothetical protein